MGFFKRLFGLFSPQGQSAAGHAYYVAARCSRCGEIVRTRVDLRNDLSLDYGNEEGSTGSTTYFTRKILIGEALCFQPIEIELRFDANRNLLDRQIKGGEFVEEG
jgi:hypothetical protein